MELQSGRPTMTNGRSSRRRFRGGSGGSGPACLSRCRRAISAAIVWRRAKTRPAAAVIEQRVDASCNIALFIAHDDVGRVQLDQLLQPVIAVDHAAIKVVEIGVAKRRHPAAPGAQFRRNHRKSRRESSTPVCCPICGTIRQRAGAWHISAFSAPTLRLHLVADLFAESLDVTFLSSSLMPSAPIMAMNLPGNSWSSWRLRSSVITSPCEGLPPRQAKRSRTLRNRAHAQFTERDIEQVADAARAVP